MSPEVAVLMLTAAAIAFTHTVFGPDHYLPFVAMAKARGWTMAKTLRITLACGAGHVLSSVVIGLVGILIGAQLGSLQVLEGLRGNIAAWLLTGFGLAYMVWGLRQAWRNRPHSHWHRHGALLHKHTHVHQAGHAHVHDEEQVSASLTPWVIFIIFVLGPCEPLIPLLMYPAAVENPYAVLLVAVVFSVVTVGTMLVVVAVAARSLKAVRFHSLERYTHALAGAAILACGLGVTLLGL